MSGPFIFSRRQFLQQTGGFSALSLAASMDKLGLASAAAQAPGYKALVCVFMFGGNDSSNMVMPITNYAQYLAARARFDPASTFRTVTGESGRGWRCRSRRPTPAARSTGCIRRCRSCRTCSPSGKCAIVVQRRHADRADHAGAVHLVQARRHQGPGQSVLAQRPAAAEHDVDRQRDARRSHRLGRAPAATRSSSMNSPTARRRCRCRSRARRRSATASPCGRCRCRPAATSASRGTAAARRQVARAAARAHAPEAARLEPDRAGRAGHDAGRAELEPAPEPDPPGHRLVRDHDGVHRA